MNPGDVLFRKLVAEIVESTKDQAVAKFNHMSDNTNRLAAAAAVLSTVVVKLNEQVLEWGGVLDTLLDSECVQCEETQ